MPLAKFWYKALEAELGEDDLDELDLAKVAPLV